MKVKAQYFTQAGSCGLDSREAFIEMQYKGRFTKAEVKLRSTEYSCGHHLAHDSSHLAAIHSTLVKAGATLPSLCAACYAANSTNRRLGPVWQHPGNS